MLIFATVLLTPPLINGQDQPEKPLARVLLGQGANVTLIEVADLSALRARVGEESGVELVLSPGLSPSAVQREVKAPDWPAALRRLFKAYPTAEVGEGGRLLQFIVLAGRSSEPPISVAGPAVTPPDTMGAGDPALALPADRAADDGSGDEQQMLEMMGVDPGEETRSGGPEADEAWLLEHMGADEPVETPPDKILAPR